MRPIGTAGHPANRTAGRWVLDAFVAFIAALSGLPEAYHSANGTAPTSEHPWGLALALFLSAAPLLVRRIWPVPVLGCVLAISLAVAIDQHTANGLALLIALYTVTAMRPRREALACAALLELFIVACAIWLAGTSWWYPAIFLSGLVGAALGLGLYSATRLAYLAELRDRAARLEHERDQQGALAAAAERARIAREMHDIVAHHLTVMVTLSDAAIAVSDASPERSERATDVMRRVSATGRRRWPTPAACSAFCASPRPNPEAGARATRQPRRGSRCPVSPSSTRSSSRSARPGWTPPSRSAAKRPTCPSASSSRSTGWCRRRSPIPSSTAGPGPRPPSGCTSGRPGELLVDINDDGAGAPPAPTTATVSTAASASTAPSGSTPGTAGGGLVGMRERARAYGGDVQAGPRETGGWKVSARLLLDVGDAP